MSISLAAAPYSYPANLGAVDYLSDDFDYGDHLDFQWTTAEADAFAPPPDLSVSECADQHRILQAGISRNPGQWSTDYTPYLRPVMDAYKIPSVRHLVFCAGTQLGKTETIYNITLYITAYDPYPTLLMSPREDDAKLISRTRVQPMIEDCQILRDKKPEKSTLFQTLEMHFPGMVLYLVGANSIAGLASKPCRNIIRDEIDKYPSQIGDDADPLSKSEERAKSFWDIRKIVDVSSPKYEGSGILKQLTSCDVINVIHHKCPHCNQYIRLYPSQLTWDDFDKDDPHRIAKAKRTAVYVCQRCDSVIHEGQRDRFIADFTMVRQQNITFGIKKEAENKPFVELEFEPEIVGFWVSSMSSPMLTWADMCEVWMKATSHRDTTGDTGKLQTVINDWWCEPWLEAVKKSDGELIMSRKCERAPLLVPEWAVAVTCGIDVQKWGFWQTTWAFDRKMRSAMIHYGFLDSWDDVHKLVFDTSFEVENSDRRMPIWRAAIDIGGGEDSQFGDDFTKSEEIITWVRDNGQGVVFPIKGMSQNKTGQKIKQSVMDKMPGEKGGLIPGGLILYTIDTYQLKDNVFWRFECGEHDPQPVQLHSEVGEDYGLQMVAEEKQRNKNGKWAYVQVKKDNHLLDCTVYAHAAADFQWMGGVSILDDPQYITAAVSSSIGEQTRNRGERTTGSMGGRSVRDKLRGRR